MKITIVLECYVSASGFTTHPCGVDDWYGEEKCKSVDLEREIINQLPSGTHEITIKAKGKTP